MIHPDSRTLYWIESKAKEYNIKDITLLEKTIRAFSLLESLVKSGCPFVFKGGTSLMLHLGSTKRLSIDIDIICPPGTHIEEYIKKYSTEYGFDDVQLVERISRTDVPKQHAKFFYQVSYKGGSSGDKILLDVLFEDIKYKNVVSMPIQSPFLKMDGEPVLVKLPSCEDLLGDKLTAFAPHTTGIPFFKGEKNCSMEINKQLYDIASLFDVIKDLNVTNETFRNFAAVELEYRHIDKSNTTAVLEDMYNTALCISLKGAYLPEEYKLLVDGISRVRSFIHSERYSLESAIVNASKAAYLSRLIENGAVSARHFTHDAILELASATITDSQLSKFNKFKKTNIEAFFYWYEISKMR